MNTLDPVASLSFGLLRAALCLVVLTPFLYSFYFLMTLPWRRRERAAMLLDLLELGRRDGRSPAETIAGLATLPDRRLPVRLHLLAAHLENGLALDAALERVPHLLPPAIRSMLQIGLRHGDPERVFTVCRQALIAPLGPAQSALIYLSLIFAIVALAGLPSIIGFRVLIEPKLQQIWADLATGTPAAAWLSSALNASAWSLGASIAISLLLYCGLFSHIGGPRLFGVRVGFDRLRLLVPWQRDRIHRDFAAMLGLLLDAGVPESVAVQEAARATDNLLMELRAEDVARRLRQGETLPHAIGKLDPAGEFRWRLENAQHGSLGKAGSRFTETLRGWLDALEARAAQRESNAVQAVMCALILSFGAAVGLHCAGVLGWLVSIVEASL